MFRVCIKTDQEICGGVLDKDSIDLTANAFIKLNKMALGRIGRKMKNQHMEDSTGKASGIKFIIAQKEDVDHLEEIRAIAFQPIFDSFRSILGDTIYEYAQLPEDEAQRDLLKSLFEKHSIWKTWKVNLKEKIIGFISIRIDESAKVGEIGLNAIHPNYSNKGIGTQMYHFAVEVMKNAGMKVATVATGGDPSHLSAINAYRKAGFTVEIPSVWMCQVIK